MQMQSNQAGSESGKACGNWYALFTRHQHEKYVAQSLTAKGFDVYLPLYRAIRRWQDREKQLCLPLFSCYVFLCEGMDRQLQVLMTPGLFHIVGCGGRPAIVPPEQLDAVRRMVESPLRVEPHPFLSSGDRVRVVSGPLSGLEGVFARTKATTRLVISVELLGRSAAVEIDAAQVERISSPPTSEFVQSASAFA